MAAMYLDNVGVWDGYRNMQIFIGCMKGRHIVVCDCDEHWIQDILLKIRIKQSGRVNVRSRMVFSLDPWVLTEHIVVHNYASAQRVAGP